jgi:hypothetical protein
MRGCGDAAAAISGMALLTGRALVALMCLEQVSAIASACRKSFFSPFE